MLVVGEICVKPARLVLVADAFRPDAVVIKGGIVDADAGALSDIMKHFHCVGAIGIPHFCNMIDNFAPYFFRNAQTLSALRRWDVRAFASPGLSAFLPDIGMFPLQPGPDRYPPKSRSVFPDNPVPTNRLNPTWHNILRKHAPA